MLFVVFNAIVLGGGGQVKSCDWTIGLLCLLPNRMCSAFGAFSAFILCFDYTKHVHIQSGKSTRSHIFHTKSTVSATIHVQFRKLQLW